MNAWGLALVLSSLTVSTAAFIWAVTGRKSSRVSDKKLNQLGVLEDKINIDVEHIFDDTFREELRNRGRLHFEKIIGENAMFLQQDLRLTTSQLNDYMKNEITQKLQQEFSKYEESITDAKQMAVESITKTQEAIEQQREMMGQQLTQEIANEKARMVKRFEDNMADIVNHYVLAAIGDQIDLNDQLEYILSDLQANKEAIIQDISHGS